MKHPSNWTPSRFHLAIFRLIGVLHLSRVTKDAEQPRVYMAFTRGQGQPEIAIVSTIWIVVPTLFITAWIQSLTGLSALWAPLLVIPALPVLFVFVTISLWMTGAGISLIRKAGLIHAELNAPLQERWHSAVMLAVAIASQWWDSWARCVGSFWLAATIVNGAAAIVLWIMKSRVAEIETRFGASSPVQRLPVQ